VGERRPRGATAPQSRPGTEKVRGQAAHEDENRPGEPDVRSQLFSRGEEHETDADHERRAEDEHVEGEAVGRVVEQLDEPEQQEQSSAECQQHDAAVDSPAWACAAAWP